MICNQGAKSEKQCQNNARTFYQDHVERDLIAPDVVKKTKTHLWIDATENEAMAELRSNALFIALGHIDGFQYETCASQPLRCWK